MTEKDELKLKIFLRLYSNYSNLANFNQNQLENFENEIYNRNFHVFIFDLFM